MTDLNDRYPDDEELHLVPIGTTPGMRTVITTSTVTVKRAGMNDGDHRSAAATSSPAITQMVLSEAGTSSG